MRATNAAQSGSIAVRYEGKGARDAFEQPVRVMRRGFPVEAVYAGQQLRDTFVMPVQEAIEGTMEATFRAYPSLSQVLVEGLDRMLRQPYGCFEQTSSTTYPNILVLDYLRRSGQASPKIESRALAYIETGLKRLEGFEVKGGGFDWFGKPPAHEALTAYGLMEFVDMSEVYSVDPDLIDRTARWLLSRRDGQGDWQSAKRGLHSWSSGGLNRAAYITWAVAEAGYTAQLGTEIDYLLDAKAETPYQQALIANVLLLADKPRAARKLLRTLYDSQQEDGSWAANGESVVNSRGKSYQVESAALAALAMMKAEYRGKELGRAMEFISNSKSPNGFGNTQATVLAMKALVEYDTYSRIIADDGTLQVYINGKRVAKQRYTAGQTETIAIAGLAKHLRGGDNEVRVTFGDTEMPLPYDMALTYYTRQPPSAAGCGVQAEVALQSDKVTVGNTVRLSATLANTRYEAVANPILQIGIPSGLTVSAQQLKELQERGTFDYYELTDGYLTLYYRGLDYGASQQVALDLKVEIPGEYEAPATTAYLYYEPEVKQWLQPVGVVVVE